MRIKISALALSLIFFTVSLSAQTPGLRITKVNVGFAFEFERLSGLNGDYLSSLSRQDLGGVYNLDQFGDQHLESMSCENPNLKIGVTLETPLLPKFEIQAAISHIRDRIDMTHYDYYNQEPTFIYMENRVNELGLDLALNRVFPVAGFMKFYAGVGTALGYAYNGRLVIQANERTVTDPGQAEVLGESISSSSTEGQNLPYGVREYGGYDYRSKNALHARGFLQLGLGFVIAKRLELGFQVRRGFGMRAQQNIPIKLSTLESSQLNLSWRLKK